MVLITVLLLFRNAYIILNFFFMFVSSLPAVGSEFLRTKHQKVNITDPYSDSLR